MKIQCQSCQAKYTIADEKVLGKVVKIRCKKCSSTIVINGNESRGAEENADTHVFDYGAAGSDLWTVNVADGDQRTLTAQEIATEYRNGVIGDETYCWKEGMADWLPLREIDALYGAIKFGAGPPVDDLALSPQSGPGAGSPVSGAPLFSAPPQPLAAAAAFPSVPPGHANGNGAAGLFGAAAEPQASATAARRAAGGRGQGADLFGNVANAGGEDDVMTSAASGGAGAGLGAGAHTGEEQKLTGQRNENSVLFSLSALTSPATEATPKPAASADGSGLIDIRALSQSMGEGDKKGDKDSRVDDIMNLSGGGAFGAALAAPILAPPPLETEGAGVMLGASPKPNKTVLFAILGAGAFIAIAIVVVALVFRSGPSETAQPASTPTSGGPTSTSTSAPTTETPAPTAPAATADNTPPPPGTGQAGAKPTPGTGAARGAAAPKVDHTPPPEPKPAAEPPPKAEGPKDFGSALAAAAGKPADTPKDTGAAAGGSTAPFDKGAAFASLGSVNVQSCKRPDGPTGTGHVTVTFAPNGTVQAAVVDQGPFPGTPVGGCIAGKFRGAHVPPFSGGPVRVGKSFSLN